MDTQGLFDSRMPLDVSKSIFSLSVLLSSVQIFNTKAGIELDDICGLETFTEFSRHVQRQRPPRGPPYQELIFLVRDWLYPEENAYGWIGGQRYLDRQVTV